MAVFRVAKVVGSLPGTLQPNTVYLVRAGAGFDLYVSDGTGVIGHALNVPAVSNLVDIVTKTAAFTLSLSEVGKYVRATFGSSADVTVPPNASVAFAIGTVINVRASGAGLVTIVQGAGVVVNTSETRTLRKQGSTASLTKVGTDEWDLTGDLELL